MNPRIFPESFAASVYELANERCTPPLIVAVPRGSHYGVRPDGATEPKTFHVTESWATRFDRHLQAMRAEGLRPYFDFDHKAGEIGYPREFFWDAARGVMAAVSWTKEGEGLILRGECTSFSPAWVHGGDGDIVGLRLNCGAILHRSTKPAFGTRMPRIAPVLKSAAMHMLADRFIRLLDRRATELRKSGDEYPAVHAVERLKRERPELFTAYELRESISSEFGKDIELAHA